MNSLGRRVALVCALSAALGAAGGGVAQAAAGSGDRAATESFLRATQRLLNNEIARVPLMKRGLKKFVDHVASTCPDALAALPAQPSAKQADVGSTLVGEAGLDSVLAAFAPLSRPERRYEQAVSRLHWQRRSITHSVITEARDAVALAKVSPSDLCADIRAAAGTGFTQMPSGTRKFVHTVGPLANGPSATLAGILKRMRPSMTAADQRAAARLASSQKRWGRLTDRALSAEGNRLGAVLGAS